MKTDTRQMRRAQEELDRQNQILKHILLQTEEIQSTLKQYESLEEMICHLKKWRMNMENTQRSMIQMTLALENVARLYEENENKIVSHAGYTAVRMPVFTIDQTEFQRINQVVGERYRHILGEFGGETIESRD